jgi:serine phosphatase RsbU (regulator of sigma subunit)
VTSQDDGPASRSEHELALLRAVVEEGLDGLVVVSPDGKMVAYNKRFAQMWPIPDDVLTSGSDDAALQSVLDRLVDPEAFLARVRDLYGRAAGSSREELELRDGRVFDRYGAALTDPSGSYLGWAWYFRDVTDERRHRLDSERFASLAADAARMGALVAVAQALGEARSEEDVLHVVTGRGAAVLEAQGAVLCLAGGHAACVRALTTSFVDEQVRADVAELPFDFPLPMVHATVTGTAHYLRDRAEAVALFPGGEELYVRARTEGSAAVPLRLGGHVMGSLSVAFEGPHPWRQPDRDLLNALASLTAQALDRIAARQAEQEATKAARRLSETLQRSLLTAPPQPRDLHIAVRYQPAAQEAQVGGDWYDAFLTADVGTTLAVGDVAGHDRDAAAAMAQVRNVLRGVAQALGEPPAAVLSALDRAMGGLQMTTMATAVLCQVKTGPTAQDPRRLVWSNAGHPPPLLVHPDGSAELLAREPDLLLGLQPDAARADHTVPLPDGACVVLYTDGLVERRTESLDAGLERLRRAVEDLYGLMPEELCDALLERLASEAEDDVALLVVRAEPRTR